MADLYGQEYGENMKIGLFIYHFFPLKYCGKPMIEKIQEKGVLKGSFFISTEELSRGLPKIVNHLQKIGVQCIEILSSPERIEAVAPYLKERKGMDLIIHEHSEVADITARIAFKSRQGRKAAKENLKWLIDTAGKIKARAIVLHPSHFNNSTEEEFKGNYVIKNSVNFQESRRLLVNTLRDCSDYASERGVILALENMPPGDDKGGAIGRTPDELLGVIDEVGSEAVQCAFDTGHANIGGSPLEYASALGDKIAHVHIHDNDGSGDQHLPLGKGNIDFGSLIKLLAEIDKKRKDEITITLECDKAGVNYEREWEKLKGLIANYC